MQPTRIEFDVTQEAMRATVAVMATQDGSIRKVRAEARKASITMAASGLLLGAVFALLEVPPVLVGISIAVLFIFFGAVMWPTRKKMALQVEAIVQKAVSDPAYRMALGWRAIEIRPDGIGIESTYGRMEVSWRGIARTHLNDDYLIITMPGPAAIPIPRASFPSDDRFDEFVSEVYRLIEAGGGNVGDSPPDDPDGAVPE